MSHEGPTLQDRIGLHVVLTAYGMSLLDGETRRSDLFRNIKIATQWYHDRYHFISALMHDEPLYTAMRVVDRDPRDLDEAKDALWSEYWKTYDSVSDLILKRRSAGWSRLVADIASAVASDRHVARDLALPDDMDASPSPSKPRP